MSDLLFSVTEALEAGLFPDVKGRTAPFWIDGENVYFNDASVQSGLSRYALLFPTSFSEVLGCTALAISGVPTVFFGNRTHLYKWTLAGGLVDVTRVDGMGDNVPYTGAATDLWSFSAWGDWVKATNGKDLPQLFKSTNFANATGLGSITTAKIVVERTPFAALFNTNIFDKDVNWCDDDDIENYVAASTNFAGQLTARGLESGIMAAKKLGTEIAFYGTNEMRKFNFIGSPLAFGILPGVPGIGATGPHAVTGISSLHYGFGSRGIWRTDGSTSEILTQGLIHKYIYDNVNRDAWYKAVMMHDQQQNMAVAFYPTGSSTVNNRGVGYNYKNKSWTIFNYGYSAAADGGVFNYPIAGDVNGNIWAIGVTGGPPTAGTDNELRVTDTGATITTGFGEPGYGQGGYGGTFNADG